MSIIIYVGIKLIRISPSNSFQLEISENAGISWSLLFGGSDEIGDFFYLGKRDSIVFAKTSKGRFRSITLGKTWDDWR